MSRRANLITLRQNYISKNTNYNHFLFTLHILRNIHAFFQKKRVFLINENLNVVCDKLYFTGSLFFETNTLKNLKKMRCFPLNELSGYSILPINLVSFLTSKFKTNDVILNFTVLNKLIPKTILSFLFNRLKIYISQLFERRFNLFLDFLKLTSLYYLSKVNLSTYLFVIADIFKYLKKRKHAKYFLFIKIVFNILVFEMQNNVNNPNLKILGIKLKINGRLKGKSIASNISIQCGRVSTQTLCNNIDYATSKTFTSKLGIIGFRAWVSKI